MNTTRLLSGLLVAALAVTTLTPAWADPLPGEILKFQQLPMAKTLVGGNEYWGHDEWSTIYGTRGSTAATPPWAFQSDPGQIGVYMADDFADNFDTPVVHVRWWGSYQYDRVYSGVKQFLISFEADVPADPADPNSFSHPDPSSPINQHQIVYQGPLASGSGTFTETLYSLPPPVGASEAIYEYNAELACPFPQQPDTVYWLKIAALVDQHQDGGNIVWGWHNRDYTQQDLLASAAVLPGEQLVGGIPGSDGTTTPIWHFQDDAVHGGLLGVSNLGSGPCDVQVQQQGYDPQRYLYGWDGPEEIGLYSKDLAFELYTVPEPSTFALAAAGLLGLVGFTRRRRCSI